MKSETKQGIILFLAVIVGMPIFMGFAINLGCWIQGAPTLSQYNDATREDRRERAKEARRQKDLNKALEQIKHNLERERAIPVKIVD